MTAAVLATLALGLRLDPGAFLSAWLVLALLAAVLPALGPARWRRRDPGSWYLAAHFLALPVAYAWTAAR